MIVSVAEEKCIGCGLCPNIAPDVFEMKEGKAVVIVDEVPTELEEDAQEAIDGCPVEAISSS